MNSYFQVIIEWDGGKPPSTWYKRMHQLGLRVHPEGQKGCKDLSPIMRRAESTNRGLILQEGCIIGASESTISALAHMAIEMGAKDVQFGTCQLHETIVKTAEDLEVLAKIQAVLGRKGPRGAPRDWTVICREKGCISYHSGTYALNCPQCHGMRTKVLDGAPVHYPVPASGNFAQDWFRSRFATGMWCPAPAAKGRQVGMIPANVTIAETAEITMGTLLQHVPITGQIAALPISLEERLAALDAIFLARTYTSSETRMIARIEVVKQYFMNGGDPAAISLSEGALPDILDGASILGIPDTLRLFHLLQSQRAKAA